MIYNDLGLIEYSDAWKVQTELFDQNIKAKQTGEETRNTLLLCEHPHVLTLGKSGKDENILFNEEALKQRGVSLFKIDRGGDVTYHGPGQIVGYPIFDLEIYKIGLKQYIHNVEDVIIKFLAYHNIQATRLDGAAGVWLDVDNPRLCRKICAIGVRSSRYVTMHGFALNVNTDMSYFSLINPCGFIDKGVTSVEKELGHKVDISEAKILLKSIFEEIFLPA